MNLFLAAVYSNGYRRGSNSARFTKLTEIEQSYAMDLPNILESWHYVGKQQFVDAMRRDEAKIFVDSGAFSAFTLGVKLSINSYCDYIKRNSDIIRVEDGAVMASVLDGIGNALETYQNQAHMEYLGVKPLPCFHAGEPEEYLAHYVKNYEYITLGGMVGASTKQLMIWLDRIWENHLTDGSGHPKLKVHGFGITSIPLMERYPWHSCDSSSWIQSAAFGGIVTPQWGPINVSTKSPSRHDFGQHVSTVTQLEQDKIFEHLDENGFSYARLSEVYESRAAYNLWAYKRIGALITAAKEKEHFAGHIQELF